MNASYPPFVMWSATHLITVGVIALVTTALICYGLRLSSENRVYYARRFGLLVAAFYVFEYTWKFCHYGPEAFFANQMLPLHFCAIMSIICVIALWWQCSWACSLVYFGVLSASIQAIFTPVLKEDFPSIPFFIFFTSHSLLLITALLQVVVLGWRARLKDPFVALLLMNVYICCIHPVNLWLGSNYGFTTEGPRGTILASLGPAPWYYLWLDVPALCLFLLMYLFVRRKPEPTLA